MKSRLTIAGIVLIVLMAAAALSASFISPHDPGSVDLSLGLEGPSWRHPMGCDELGRDIFSRLIHGTRVSLAVGIAVVFFSLTVGTAVGALAGYAGGAVDGAIMRIVDILMAFPGLLLAIAVAGVLGPSFVNVVLALCLMGWVGFARLVRGQVLALREREFVTAARAIGAGPFRILTRYIFPELAAPLLVQATFAMAGAVLAESSLSFLGLGPQDLPTWGAMLSEGVDYMLFAPHLSVWPGLAVCLTVLAFNFIGDGLRDALDVKN